MKRSRKVLFIILGLLILLQFIRPNKNLSATESKNDIFMKYPAADSVKSLVRTSCYDCHSNNTEYPWYTNIQPIGLWMNHHVNEGKGELNFSEFLTYSPKKAEHKLKEATDEIKKGGMPISSYTLIHHDAKLSKEQRKAVISWIETTRKQILQ